MAVLYSVLNRILDVDSLPDLNKCMVVLTELSKEPVQDSRNHRVDAAKEGSIPPGVILELRLDVFPGTFSGYDVRTTMNYTHIGMDDRARALGNLRWQRIGSEARDVRRQSVAANDNGKALPVAKEGKRNNGKSCSADAVSHAMATADSDQSESAKRVRFPPPPLSNTLNHN